MSPKRIFVYAQNAAHRTPNEIEHRANSHRAKLLSGNGKMSKMLQLMDLETRLLNDFLTCYILWKDSFLMPSRSILPHWLLKKLKNIRITCQNHLWGGNHPPRRKFSRSLPDYKWHNRYLFRLFRLYQAPSDIGPSHICHKKSFWF